MSRGSRQHWLGAIHDQTFPTDAWSLKMGSDSHSMNLAGEVVLFSEGNQHHGGQIAFVVSDP